MKVHYSNTITLEKIVEMNTECGLIFIVENGMITEMGWED